MCDVTNSSRCAVRTHVLTEEFVLRLLTSQHSFYLYSASAAYSVDRNSEASKRHLDRAAVD